MAVIFGLTHIAIAIVWSAKKFEELLAVICEISEKPSETDRWLETLLKKIYSSKQLIIWGTITCPALFALVYFESKGFTGWYSNNFSRYYFMFLWALAAFIGGAGINVVIRTMLIPNNLKNKKLRLSLFRNRMAGLRRVGMEYIGFSIIIILASLTCIVGVKVSPIRNHIGVNIMALVFTALAIYYFFITQMPIHRILVQEKEVILKNISDALEDKVNGISLHDPNVDGIQIKVKEFLDMRNEILSISEWSFRFPSISILLALLSSLLPTILAQSWIQITEFFKSLLNVAK